MTPFIWAFAGLAAKRRLDPVGGGTAFLHFPVKAVEQGEILLPAVPDDQGGDPAAFFKVFERKTHRIAAQPVSPLSRGSRP